MNKTILAIAAFALLGGILVGCANSGGEPEGYKKEDFSRRPPPAGYVGGGGGAPGGAPAGAPGGAPGNAPAAQPKAGDNLGPANGGN